MKFPIQMMHQLFRMLQKQQLTTSSSKELHCLGSYFSLLYTIFIDQGDDIKQIKFFYRIFSRTDNFDFGCDDRIELKVFGIASPGSQITHDLVELLDRKLVSHRPFKHSITEQDGLIVLTYEMLRLSRHI